MKKAIGYVYVIAAAVCWGFLGLFNRVLTAAGVSLLNMMPLRFGGTAILFTVFCMMFKQQVFHIKLRHLPIFLGSGLISMLLVLCGCALVSGIVGSDVGISLEGLLMGLASELCYGGYTIFTHYGMRYCDSFTMAYWTFLIAGIASLFLADGPALLSALAEPRTGLAALGLIKGEKEKFLRNLESKAFGEQLYQKWNLDPDYTYRSVGHLVTVNQKVMILFDFSHPEVWKTCKSEGTA